MLNEEILKRTEEGMKESGRVLIRELVRDLEEKGISPVWAIDGEVKKLKIICKSEAEDFAAEIKKFGMEEAEFCLLEEDRNTDSQPHHLIIVHKKSGKVKQYKNLHWISDLHRDLADKFFTN